MDKSRELLDHEKIFQGFRNISAADFDILSPDKLGCKVGKECYRSITEAILLYNYSILTDETDNMINSFIRKNGHYDNLFTPMTLASYYESILFIFEIKQRYPDFNKIRILDVGTYLGLFVSFMHDLGFDRTFGIDFIQINIDVASKLGIGNVLLGSFEKMNELFDQGSFDIIVSMGVVNILDQPEFSEQESLFFSNSGVLLSRNGILIFRPKECFGDYHSRIRSLLENNGFDLLYSGPHCIFYAQKR